MALRNLIVEFEHFAPGDVEATAIYTNTIGDQAQRTVHGIDEMTCLMQITASVRTVIATLDQQE
jgi:hypothetical protein